MIDAYLNSYTHNHTVSLFIFHELDDNMYVVNIYLIVNVTWLYKPCTETDFYSLVALLLSLLILSEN